jgi:putative ABC transport system permease protein
MVDDLYKSERRLGNMVLYFSLLTILIACMGLFGLASFTAEQRTKEIGIRKILGASAPGIVLLLSRQFGKLILIANLIAWPAAYFILRRWLDNFYYRIGIGVWVFAGAAALVIVIGLLSVSYQSLKAALSDPVDSLRYE